MKLLWKNYNKSEKRESMQEYCLRLLKIYYFNYLKTNFIFETFSQ